MTAPFRERQRAAMTASTLPPMPLDENTARELSRAAKQVTSWTERRNTLIRDALAAGHGVREVARATGLAPATVLNIVKPKKRGTT
jgi:DNA-binding NarL/FixJ family response regulator